MGAACTGQTGVSLITIKDEDNTFSVARKGKVPKKVLLIGQKEAGKTTLLYCWSQQSDTVTKHTESFNVELISGVKAGQAILVWDVTDTARRRQFFHGTEGIIYVVDGEDTASFQAAKGDLNMVVQETDLVGLPLLVVISKLSNEESLISGVHNQLGLSDIAGSRKLTCVCVTKDSMVTYNQALEQLCEMLYTAT